MSSRKGFKAENLNEEGCSHDEAVNTPSSERALKSFEARIENNSCEEQHDLMEKVVSRENMIKALKRVKQNKGAPGIDGMEVEELLPYLHENWAQIKEQLLEGTYKPSPVRRVEIPKPDGSKRQLGIPTVLDRLIQQAMLQQLSPIFEKDFSEHSYGFRPGRSAHQAIQKAKGYIKDGYQYVVDIDLEKFFDRVNHDILMARVAKKVKDKRALKITRAYLNAGIMVNGIAILATEGAVQGGPLSPLLSNILLDDLDKELEERGHRFVRYADDCNIYTKSERAGHRVMDSICGFVEKRLKLKVNKDKSAVDRPENRKFLGFSFIRLKTLLIRVAPQSIRRFKDRIRRLTKRSWSISMERRINEINTYIRGWMNYFKLSELPDDSKRLDSWIRRRLRMCVWKQWKNPKTRIRKLIGLGVYPDRARKMGGSRKGCWTLSRTTQLNMALSNAYWREQGLICLVDIHKLPR